MCRRTGAGFLIGSVVLALACTSHAQAEGSGVLRFDTIAAARTDRDRDGYPDRNGEMVTLRGWATVDAGVLHPEQLLIFIQDDTAGIQLHAQSIAAPVNAGDYVEATGWLGQRYGVTRLDDVRYTVGGAPARKFEPVSLCMEEFAEEAFEGQLVRVRGTVVAKQTNPGGELVILHDQAHPGESVVVFRAHRAASISFQGVSPGDTLEVVGLASQHDLESPYTSYYEVLPRAQKDLRSLGVTSRNYRHIGVAASVVALASALWLTALRIQVRNRTRELRESEQRFRSMFEGNADAVFLLDEEGIVKEVNPAAAALLGSEAAAIPGRSFWSLLHDHRGDPLSGSDRLLPSGEAMLDARMVRADGTTVPVDIRFSPLGKAVHGLWLAVARDVTSRKEAELALHAEKERLSVTLRSIGDGVLAADHQGRIVLINGVAERLTGLTLEEAQAKTLNEVFRLYDSRTRKPLANQERLLAAPHEIIELPGSILLASHDGAFHPIAASIAPMRTPGRSAIGTVIAFRDMSVRERMEQEQLRSSKLESVGLLAGGIAHDFNNILTLILGNLALARSGGNGHLAEYLREAETAAVRARDLTRQLLTFAKGGDPVRRVSALSDVIRESTTLALTGSAVRGEVRIPEGLWPADVDPGQIYQVINNMVINAQQAMPNGGVVRISAVNCGGEELEAVGLDPAHPFIRIDLADEGVGIDRENLSRIFDPYFTTKQKGSGLGLATCYSIVRKHGGRITLESELGCGTTFHIYLPARPDAIVTPTREDLSPLSGSGRILIMDDEPGVRKVAVRMLRSLGYEVQESAEGSEAIGCYRAAMEKGQPFDLVIFDLTIPGGMGGVDAVRELRKLDPEVKAIVVSGYSNDPVLSSPGEFGFAGVVAKPFTTAEFARVVAEVCNGETMERSALKG